jgi:hypothetical protein
MHPIPYRTPGNITLIVSAPLLLALLEFFHPHPHDLLQLDVRAWLFVHYAQIPLFALSALAVANLVRGCPGLTATVCRVAMFLFACSFMAFDTAAGVVTGILVEAARASTDPETWRIPIDTVWLHPVVGGVRISAAPSLATLGAASLAVGTVAAAVTLRRAGHAWPPLLLLAGSGFGIELFNTHAWPGGPLTFGGIALAAGWLHWRAVRAPAVLQTSSAPIAARVPFERRRNWSPSPPLAD